jgi:hypothetical protein
MSTPDDEFVRGPTADYEVQCRRIIRAVKNLCPSCVVAFDSNQAPKWLRFRIEYGSTTLTKAYPEFHVSEVTDWSDEKLSQVIKTVTGGLARKCS